MSSVVSSIFGGTPAGTVSGGDQAATADQARQQYQNVQTGLDQQQAFLRQIQAQNGLQNQSNVYNQLSQISQGQGPNPAQALLNQATGQNVAAQAALMAGQRGASANPALIARQAANQGANLQQQAVGQGATMQANQALNAIGAMGNLATQQAQQQAQATKDYSQQALQGQSNVLGALTGQNQINSQAAQQNAQLQGNLISNLTGAAGSAMGLAEGGMVQQGPRSKAAMYMANGGKVPAMVSPGEQYLPPQAAKAVAQGKAQPLSVGERIPGQPKVSGNSYLNDTVPKMLQEGGVVIPNSIMQSSDPEKNAAAFVRKVMAKKGLC